jgi:hypothetical protein
LPAWHGRPLCCSRPSSLASPSLAVRRHQGLWRPVDDKQCVWVAGTWTFVSFVSLLSTAARVIVVLVPPKSQVRGKNVNCDSPAQVAGPFRNWREAPLYKGSNKTSEHGPISSLGEKMAKPRVSNHFSHRCLGNKLTVMEPVHHPCRLELRRLDMGFKDSDQ